MVELGFYMGISEVLRVGAKVRIGGSSLAGFFGLLLQILRINASHLK